jgi:benzodiazapine receptor
MTDQRPTNSDSFALIVFLIIAVGISLLLGYFTAPGEWFAGLEKPPFNPPNWLFAPVWVVLYFCIAFAGYLVWRRQHRGAAITAWAAQMVLNWSWSPVFFRLQAPWLAVAIIVATLAAIVAFMALAWRIDKRATWLFVPYAAWVSFATVLNIAIAALN